MRLSIRLGKQRERTFEHDPIQSAADETLAGRTRGLFPLDCPFFLLGRSVVIYCYYYLCILRGRHSGEPADALYDRIDSR